MQLSGFPVRALAFAAATLFASSGFAATKTPISGSALGSVSSTSTVTVSPYIDINLTGWLADDDFGYGNNSFVFVNITPGATVTGFDYLGLQFTTDPNGDSWQSELVLSVNNDTGSAFLDWSPSTTDSDGTFGPASGSFGGATGAIGPYGSNTSFVSASGTLLVTTYLAYYDPPVGINIDAGTLRIYYTAAAVPEPATYGLMGLGLLGVAGAARRRMR